MFKVIKILGEETDQKGINSDMLKNVKTMKDFLSEGDNELKIKSITTIYNDYSEYVWLLYLDGGMFKTYSKNVIKAVHAKNKEQCYPFVVTINRETDEKGYSKYTVK